jgi:hypothetical protein
MGDKPEKLNSSDGNQSNGWGGRQQIDGNIAGVLGHQ